MKWTPPRWRWMIYIQMHRRTTYDFQFYHFHALSLRPIIFHSLVEYIHFLDCSNVKCCRPIFDCSLEVRFLFGIRIRYCNVWYQHTDNLSAPPTVLICTKDFAEIDDEVTSAIEHRLVFCLYRTSESSKTSKHIWGTRNLKPNRSNRNTIYLFSFCFCLCRCDI